MTSRFAIAAVKIAENRVKRVLNIEDERPSNTVGYVQTDETGHIIPKK
jgi:hypothetical protein